jgi:putative membrane protein
VRERHLKKQVVCNFQRCRCGAHLRNGPMNLVETMPRDRGTVLAEERTDLALERTIIASERTLMAWIRTALSMIGFGFSIYKFFQYLPEEIATGNIQRPQAPRNLGMSLIALGTLALTAGAWQHRRFLNRLGASQGRHVWSVSFVVAMAAILIGIITFYGVLLRHGPF